MAITDAIGLFVVVFISRLIGKYIGRWRVVPVFFVFFLMFDITVITGIGGGSLQSQYLRSRA